MNNQNALYNCEPYEDDYPRMRRDLVIDVRMGVGPQGPRGEQGEKGDPPVRGEDYWTEEDKAEIISTVETDVAGDVESAVERAVAAKDAAETAKTEAQTAQVIAADWAASATTKAGEAAASAATAVAYCNSAETFKDLAQAAKTAADSAKTAAEGYVEDAEQYAIAAISASEDASVYALSAQMSDSNITNNSIPAIEAIKADTEDIRDEAEGHRDNAINAASHAEQYAEAAAGHLAEVVANTTLSYQYKEDAISAAANADAAILTVQGYVEDAEAQAEAAQISATEAATYAENAAAMAEDASESAEKIIGLTAVAETLPEGSTATASYDSTSGTLTLGIPTGATGAQGPQGEPGEDYVLTEADKAEIAGMVNVPVTDVQIDGSSVVQDGVADIPTGSTSAYGVYRSATVAVIKAGTALDRVPTVGRQNSSVFYGLASAAGDTTQSVSDNAVGTYTAEAKAAIQTMLDVPSASDVVTDVQVNGSSVVDAGVANVPIATEDTPGVIKVSSTYGLDVGTSAQHLNYLRIVPASSGTIKRGDGYYSPVTVNHHHESAFYGLAKAAGDTTQSESSNAVGTYTDEAKVAIQKMLGIYEAPWELIREDTVTNDTEADIIINADSNGQTFELTDVRLVLVSPQQDTAFSKADYGRVRSYYQTGAYDIIFIGAYTQAAGASAKVSYISFEQRDGMLTKVAMPNTARSGMGPWQTYANEDGEGCFVLLDTPRIYSRVNITKVTGTAHYILYGKRKVV